MLFCPLCLKEYSRDVYVRKHLARIHQDQCYTYTCLVKETNTIHNIHEYRHYLTLVPHIPVIQEYEGIKIHRIYETTKECPNSKFAYVAGNAY